MQLAIWCDNCADENYFAEGFNDAGGLFFYGKLRQAGIELTKRYERVERGTLSELATQFEDAKPKGEVTVVIAGKQRKVARRSPQE